MSLYKQVTSSPSALIQFYVDTQYPEMINRAISVNLVNSDVGEENLYNELMRPDVIGSPQYNEILNFQPTESVALSAEANQVIRRLNAVTAPRALMSQSTPYFCNPSFQGELTMEQQFAVANGACNGPEGNGLSGDNIADITQTAGGILDTIFDFVDGITGGGNQPPADGGGDNQNNNGNQGSGNDTNYTPWVFGGIALLIIIIVAVILYQKTKG